jgi:hypothetical protein
MNKVKHCEYRNCDVTIIDTPRHVDNDGFILDMTDAEVAKVRQVPERYEVIDAVEYDYEPIEAPATVIVGSESFIFAEVPVVKPAEAKPIETKNTPKPVASAKRGRPSNNRK